MKLIFVSRRLGATRTLNFTTAMTAAVAIVGLIVALLFGSLGYQLASANLTPEQVKAISQWQEDLQAQQQRVRQTEQKAEDELNAMAIRVAELQARVVRLDALGERLTSMAKLESGEFDFSRPPALGGPEEPEPETDYQKPALLEAIGQLAVELEDREQQLEILETLMANRQLEDAGYIAGRPIKKGWMSSSYGQRTDPFHGHLAWHKGMDFAGKEGSDVIAVASGVVTWSGDRYGYGQMVEVNHGNGFATRYAHNSENLVAVGDVVKKGQAVAKMGSSGRSTGPHVHFEVYKDGRAVNPSRYINRPQR